MEAKSGLVGKLLVRQSCVFSLHHEQIPKRFDFERKGLPMVENPRFFEVFDVDCALCKCQMRVWGPGN